ncbi:MAG TPA: alanine racemase [Candidatus Limnocylindrales bacterium]|nr:alanine racemase [Candidatus Limnocylindrales bacterium]
MSALGDLSIEARLARAGLPRLPRFGWLEVDVEALAGNLAAVRSLAAPGARVIAVVKADGYGHGLEVAGRTFDAAGADALAVATLDEGLRLRQIVPDRPILVLFDIPPALVPEAAAARLELTVSEPDWLEAALAAVGSGGTPSASGRVSRMDGCPLRLHVEVETGLQRAGLRPEAAAGAAERIRSAPGAELVGLWTHLARAEDPIANAEQRRTFDEALRGLDRAGIPRPAQHVSATGGLFGPDAAAESIVRPGLSLYGALPEDLPLSAPGVRAATRLRPALALKARLLRLESVEPGETVGYGGTWRAQRPSRIATLPIGYGDGWPRVLGWGRSRALVRGRSVPLVGTVAMDALAADVTDVEPEVTPDDEFVLLGSQGQARIDVTELAQARTTISWEVLVAMAARLPRVYHAGREPVGLRTLAGEFLTSRGPRG